MTKATLLADLKNMIGPGVEVDDVGLTRWLNDAYLEMVEDIQKAVPDYFVSTDTQNIVASQQEYTMPSDWSKVMMVNIQYQSGTWQRAHPISINDIAVHASSNSSGFSTGDPGYYLIGDTIGFAPIPSSNITNGLKIWYVYDPAELSADSDVPAIPTKYQHIIKYAAYANYLDQDDEHVAAERMRQRFDLRVFRMIEELSERQVDEPMSVSIVTNQDMYIDDGFSV